MKVPHAPKILVELGRAVELDTSTWLFTWNKSDDYVVASNTQGNTIFIFPKSRKNPDECKTGMEAQSILFAADKWTDAKAKKWLRDHGFKTPKVHKTANYLRYRQAPPDRYKKGQYATEPLSGSKGILAVFGCPKASRKNPASGDIKKARSLFKRFNHYDAKKAVSLRVADAKSTAGRGLHIIYNSDKFGPRENHIHKFITKPFVAVDNFKKPTMLVLYGGKIKITSRGIEG